MTQKRLQQVNVYIGRFQPLHNGHAHILDKMFENQNDLGVILIGSSFQARTIKNPFTFEEREDMIVAYLNNKKIKPERYEIRPIADQPYNDSKWIQSVQEHVADAIKDFTADAFFDLQTSTTTNPVRLSSDFEISLVGSDRDATTWYLKAFPQFKLNLSEASPAGKSLNATSVRDELFTASQEEYSSWGKGDGSKPGFWHDLPQTTQSFVIRFTNWEVYQVLRQEYAFIKKYRDSWASAPYAPIFSCVDAVVIQSGHVLAIQRGALPGKGLWALPGGFVGQRDRLVDAAIRELVEETGIKVPEPVLKGSIKAKEIFDAPDRSLRGRTISTAFLIRLDDTKPLPKVKGQNAPLHETGGVAVVETLKAKWIPISEARANSAMWMEDHHAIIDWAVGAIKD